MTEEDYRKQIDEQRERQERMQAIYGKEHLDWFIRTYMPKDEELAWRFQSDMIDLVQRISRDAARPYEATMSKVLEGAFLQMPMPPLFVKKVEP